MPLATCFTPNLVSLAAADAAALMIDEIKDRNSRKGSWSCQVEEILDMGVGS